MTKSLFDVNTSFDLVSDKIWPNDDFDGVIIAKSGHISKIENIGMPLWGYISNKLNLSMYFFYHMMLISIYIII